MAKDQDTGPKPETPAQEQVQTHEHEQVQTHEQAQSHDQAHERAQAKLQAGAEVAAQADVEAKAKAEAEVDRRLLESSLVRLRATGHPLLRSMADDLLAGRVSMRGLARNPDIAPPIQAAARRYLNWRNRLSDAELKAVTDEMAARVQWMRDQVARNWRKRDLDGEGEGERGSHADR